MSSMAKQSIQETEPEQSGASSDAESVSISTARLTDVGHHHLDSFDEFFDRLNRAAKSAIPRGSRRYSDVFVLLLRWEDDDLGTEAELTDLDAIFRDIYHFHTDRYLIPTDDSTTQLEYRLTDFRKAHDKDTNLLILYYGGHGFLERRKGRSSRSIWQAKLSGEPLLVWSDLQGVLMRAKSDVVFILDCCYAASAARGGGSKEGLWACNSEVTTTGVNDNSFTRNLIEEIRSLSNSRYNIAMLHARLMRRYRRPGPHMLLTEPWYTYLADAALPSTELAPQLMSKSTSSGGHSSATSTASSSQTSSASSVAASLTVDQSFTETLVLLAVRLKDAEHVPGLKLWQDWCHDLAPEDIASVHALGRVQVRDLVKLEAHFLSHSGLLLVSMPVFIWDRLPDDPAYSFVGYITSRNRHFPGLNLPLKTNSNTIMDREDRTRVKTAEKPLIADHEPLRQGYSGTGLTSQANLASMYRDQGRWREAEELDIRVMETMKGMFGAEHLDALTSTNNLASIYQIQVRWKEDEEREIQVLEMMKRVFGKEHLRTSTRMANLASTYHAQGRFQEAEELAVRVVEISSKVLNEEHPYTLASMTNLAMIYKDQGRFQEAEKLCREVIRVSSKVLAKKHPSKFNNYE